MNRSWIARTLALAMCAGTVGCTVPTHAGPLELSFYYDVNLGRDDQVQALDTICRRAAAAGYSKVMLSDTHFARLDAMDDHYRANARHVKDLATRLGLEVVPLVFQVGRSNQMLGRDPSLAEGLPVRRALFVVHGGEARLVADPAVAFSASPSWSDPAVRIANGVVTTAVAAGRGRFRFSVAVSRFRCYHASVRIRSRGFEGKAQFYPMGDEQTLEYTNPLSIEPTQDWRTYDLVFDSLDHDQVTVWMGVWKGSAGELEWTDWRIEEVGLLNVLRRPGAPCVVEGRVEGRDYQMIRDPALEPGHGDYVYSEWHEPPVIRTGLPDGTQLRVSWYQPCLLFHGVTTCCPSDSGTIAQLGDEATRMKQMWDARGYLLGHDEIRCFNWDPSCAAQGTDAGAVLAAHMRRCLPLLGGAQAYVWSDMFDPFHNAHADYYLVRGDLKGSWEGLDPKAIILNWDAEHRGESLRFFSQRGNRQIIAGYYDSDLAELEDWLTAARGVPGVMGVMYTTWKHRYDDLEKFAGIVKARAGGE